MAKKPKPAVEQPAPDRPADQVVQKADGSIYRRRRGAKKTSGRDKGRNSRPSGAGRPLYQPTDEQKALVTVMVAGGIQHHHIATALGISRPTLEKAFKHEIENAAAQANAKVIAALFKECGGGNIRAIEFWLTNRASSRWAHKQKVDGNLDMNVQLADRVMRARKKLKRGE